MEADHGHICICVMSRFLASVTQYAALLRSLYRRFVSPSVRPSFCLSVGLQRDRAVNEQWTFFRIYLHHLISLSCEKTAFAKKYSQRFSPWGCYL